MPIEITDIPKDIDPTLAVVVQAWIMIEAIRADEGHSITINCDNPNFFGPNSVVDVVGDFTGWLECRYEGDSVYAAIKAAYESMMAHKNAIRDRIAKGLEG